MISSTCKNVVLQVDCFHLLGWDIEFFVIGLNGLRNFSYQIFQKEPLNLMNKKKYLTQWAECTGHQAFSPIACFISKLLFSQHWSQGNPKYLFLEPIRSGFSTCWTKTKLQHRESNPDIWNHLHIVVSAFFRGRFSFSSYYSNGSKMSCSRLPQNRVSKLLNTNKGSKIWVESHIAKGLHW